MSDELGIAYDFAGDPPVAIIGGIRLDGRALRDHADAINGARHRLIGEEKRRADYAGREQRVDTFRRCWPDRLVDYALGDRAILLSLFAGVGEIWPVAIDPATGQDVESSDVHWAKLPVSPWGPIWLRATRRHATAHLWMGGPAFVCGFDLPGWWTRKVCATPDQYEASTHGLSMNRARRCPKCEAKQEVK